MNLSFLRRYQVLIFAGFFSFCFTCKMSFAQVTELKNNYGTPVAYNLKEKIYLHTDRSFYLCGQILWFKAYLTDASNNHPLDLSKVAYVELLDKTHQPVLQSKILVQQASGNGSFFLPFSLASGNYELRAYTNWMKNFSPDHFFKKIITIVNTARSPDTSTILKLVSYHAEFFPEGGNLVNGLESEIAFKAINNTNKGIDCHGVVVDQDNDTVVLFKSQHFGMGHFYLKPQAGKEYTAVVNFDNASVIRKALPKAFDAGYVMHIADTGKNDLKVIVTAAGQSESITPDIYIIVQNSGRVVRAVSKHPESGSATFEINKDSLKDGMTCLTVFNKNKQPQCERLYFKRPENKMILTAGTDKNSYHFRDKVTIAISSEDQTEQRLAGNMSAAVFKVDSLHQPDAENIFSYLWLSSNLNGAIENPAYYFKNEDAETNEALNDLLLVQGWRKFDWNKDAQSHAPSFSYIPEHAGHIISGKITYKANRKPAPDVLVYLSVPGRRIQLKGCRSDSSGMVYFDMKDFFGANQLVMQTDTGNDSVYHLEIFSPFSEAITAGEIPPLHISENEEDYLKRGSFNMQVENGYHEKEIEATEEPDIDTLPFYHKADKTYLLDKYTRFTTMEEVMREYVNEISVRRSGDDFRLMSLNLPALPLQDLQPVERMFKPNPLVLLDGVPVFDINKIIAYNPLKVQKLEVVASKYYWGPIVAFGIASYSTYKGNLDGYTLNPEDLVVDYEGLQEKRIFYSPDYSSDKEQQSPLPDFRDVLYWSPGVTTNDMGKGSFSFYTGDVAGRYVVVVQGISSNGNAGSKEIILNVEK